MISLELLTKVEDRWTIYNPNERAHDGIQDFLDHASHILAELGFDYIKAQLQADQESGQSQVTVKGLITYMYSQLPVETTSTET